MQFSLSYAATWTSVITLKTFIDEKRPDGSDNKSFPSAHTASAFSGATFIHKRYGWRRAAVPYFIAGFTGYSRIQSDRHHFHDVLAGAAIAGLFTWVFTSSEEKGEPDVQLELNPDYYGLRLKARF